jgi:hypothetical protein
VPRRYRCFWRRQLHDQLVHARCRAPVVDSGAWMRRRRWRLDEAAAAATRKGPRA